MSGVINTTQRLIVLRCIRKSNKSKGVKIRLPLAPGLNSVDDEIWDLFSKDDTTKQFIKDGWLKDGDEADDLELEQSPEVKLPVDETPVDGSGNPTAGGSA